MKSIILSSLFLVFAVALPSEAAFAADGCTVLLCLSNPKGPKAVNECIQPIEELTRDLAKGKAFPKCDLSNGGDTGNSGSTNATHALVSSRFCPEGYLHDGKGSGDVDECKMAGAISITIDNKPYTRIWYQRDGGTYTEYGPDK